MSEAFDKWYEDQQFMPNGPAWKSRAYAAWQAAIEHIKAQRPTAWHLSCEEQEDTLDFDTEGWSHAWKKQPLYRIPEDV